MTLWRCIACCSVGLQVEYNMESLQDKAGRSLHDENGRICLLHYPSGLAVLVRGSICTPQQACCLERALTDDATAQ